MWSTSFKIAKLQRPSFYPEIVKIWGLRYPYPFTYPGKIWHVGPYLLFSAKWNLGQYDFSWPETTIWHFDRNWNKLMWDSHTPWSIKNVPILFFRQLWQILTDFRNFFTTIFRKELWNKNLSKFSPHLKSALPCETWNVNGESCTPLIYRALCAGALSCCMEYEIVTRYFLDARQQLLLQQYFTIIVAIHFHPRLHNFIFQQGSAPAHRARDTIALVYMPRDARLHFSRPVAPKQPRYKPRGL